MQVVTGNREVNIAKRTNLDLRPGLALAITLPILLPAAGLAHGGSGFAAGGMPISAVPTVHVASHHTSVGGWTNSGLVHSSTLSNAFSSSQYNALAQTVVVHNLLTPVLSTTQSIPTLTKTVTLNAFDLDLSSKTDTVIASQIPGFGSGTVTIRVGNQNLSVSGSTQLTQAEASAVYQVLTTGKQTLTIDAAGAASGGSLTIAPAYSQSVDGLSIPKGVSVIDESASNATLLLSSGLVNNGNFYVLSAAGSALPVSVTASTIDNSKGSLISVTLPSSLTGLSGYHNGTNLVLIADTVNNGGSIYAPGNLTLTTSTVQNDGSITAKSGNLTVQNNGGNLSVNGAGSFNAGRIASFDVASSSSNTNPSLSINGNSIAAKTVDFNDKNGALNVNAGSIAGAINSTAATVYINSTNSGLNILTINATGDPTITSAGNIVLSQTTIRTVNEPFTILSGGNVTTSDSAKDTMDASSLTGAGGDITIGAGVTFAVGGTTITGKSTTGGSINLPGISLNTNSANITLVANQGTTAKTGTINILNITDSGAGLGLYHDGGTISITADGNITTSKITSTGLAATGGDGGNVTIVSHNGSVTTSDISVNGGSGTPGAKGTSGAGGDGGDGGDGYLGGALGPNGTIGGTGGYGGAAGMNYGGAGGAGAKNVGDQPGTGVAATPGKAGTPLGGNGGNGGQALTGAFAGLDGKAGQDGVDGTDASKDGRDGGDAGTVNITAHTSINTGKITAVGGAGGGGGAGGDGGNGGNGGGGGYGGQPPTPTGTGASGSPGLAGGNGGDGGTGGGGGDGSDGGDGGNGGTVRLTAGTTIISKGIDVTGGAGGSGGKGGKGGDGGYGGDAGDGGNGGSGGPDSLAYVEAFDLSGTPGAAIYVANYNATAGSGAGADGGSGGNGGAAGDGGDGGSGGNGGKGGDAGSIFMNAGSTISVTSIARAGGAGGNGGAAGQGGQYGKGGDGGDGGDGGGTSFVVLPPGSPPNGPGTYMGLPVLNPDNPQGGLPFNPNGYVQGAGGAGGTGGDGGSGSNNQGARSGDGGSGGDAGIGGLSGNLTISSAKTPSIGSQIFFNGPSGVAGVGASFGMAPAPGSTMPSMTNPPPVFTQTGMAGIGGNGVATGPFIPLAPNPNPGSNAAAASGMAGMAGQDGDSGANGSSPTPRGGSGTTSITVGGNSTTVNFPKVSVNPPITTPPIVKTWQSTAQGSAMALFTGLFHVNAAQQEAQQATSRSPVHSDFAGAMASVANTADSSSTTSRAIGLANNPSSTAGSITVNPATLTLVNSTTPLFSTQTLAGITDVNSESLPRLALLPNNSPLFQLSASVLELSQGATETRQFFRPKENVTLDFGDTKVSMQKNAVAFIVRKGDDVSVYNLGDGKKGEIAVSVNGHQLELGISQQAVVSVGKVNDFAAANLDSDIAWRTPRVQVLPDGKRVYAADFSIVSAMQKLYAGRGKVAGLEALDAKATAKMIKNAAVLATLIGADYVQTADAKVAK